MARLKHPQRSGIEIAALVLRSRKIIVLDLAETLAAESRGAHVVTGGLRWVAASERFVDTPVDRNRHAGRARRRLVLTAGSVIEVDHRAASKWNVVVERVALHG